MKKTLIITGVFLFLSLAATILYYLTCCILITQRFEFPVYPGMGVLDANLWYAFYDYND
jgi:hypothetical protein